MNPYPHDIQKIKFLKWVSYCIEKSKLVLQSLLFMKIACSFLCSAKLNMIFGLPKKHWITIHPPRKYRYIYTSNPHSQMTQSIGPIKPQNTLLCELSMKSLPRDEPQITQNIQIQLNFRNPSTPRVGTSTHFRFGTPSSLRRSVKLLHSPTICIHSANALPAYFARARLSGPLFSSTGFLGPGSLLIPGTRVPIHACAGAGSRGGTSLLSSRLF